MSDQTALKRLLVIPLIALIAFLWASVKPANASDKSHFGTDGFGSYQHGFTSLSEIQAYFAWEAEQIATAGITWNRTLSPAGGQFSWYRIEEIQGIYYWEIADALVKACQDWGIHLLVLVKPFVSWDQPTKTDKEYGNPNDMDAWKNFLKAVVERYDGDGVDDMPGLKSGYGIKYWEIDNEPEIGKYGGTNAGSQQYQDYYDTLKAAYEAIKSADSNAKVLNAGASPIFDPVTGANETRVTDFWDNVITNLGGANYIDILNFHGTVPEPPPRLKDLVDYWGKFNKEMWVTECGTYSGAAQKDGFTWPYQSEEYQAGWWVKYCCYGLANNVTKLFWANFYHGDYTPDWFQYSVMVKSDKSTKLVYTTQKVMASKIDNFSSVSVLAKGLNILTDFGEPSEGKYKFTVDGNPVYVLWGSGSPPSEITGKVKVTDINGTEQTMDASSLTLSDNPVFVEYLSPTVTTSSATSVTSSSATLNGTVNPNGTSTNYYFEYGTSTTYGSKTTEKDAGSGTSNVSVSADLTGLSSSTAYHFRLVATNSGGTSQGEDKTFTTSASGGGGGGCTIATACYGTPMADEVKTLCTFRDRYLLTNPMGRALVKLYNEFSPRVAEFIRDKEPIKAIVRAGLKPIVWIIRKTAK